MSSDVFVIYQIDNSEKNREYRCRSYEYQIQHGFMITADNYGTATRGMGVEAIRKKMESINPDKFKIRKFGVSDVIGLTAEGKTSFFYVDKDRLVRFNGFFTKPQSGTYLILDEGGYQVAGQKGTWLVSDEVEVDGQRFVQMRSEQTKNPPPSIILHESGAFVTQTDLGFDGEATRKMARNQRKYDAEYKVQAVKLSNEIGSSKAAVELGIPVDTLYGWVKAVKDGRLDIGVGAHTPQTAMSLAEELNTLRKQIKQQEKEIRRLKEENEFLAEASAFFAASRRKSAKGSE